MNCWHCNDEMIWGGDHDCEDNEEYTIESNFSCNTCGSVAYVYLPRVSDEA
mgnify:FL=1